MQANKPKILVITPVRHIAGVSKILEATGQVTYMDDPTVEEVVSVIGSYDAIFTNPNKSKVFIGRDVLNAANTLKVICTASTGTNHIDKDYVSELRLPILSLTEEREVINRISSTAELAFAITMASLRNIVRGHNAVMGGEWDYTRYIGRQMNALTVGVIGYGRLGSMYASYCKAFHSNVLVYDPYKKVHDDGLKQVDTIDRLLVESDIIAIHIHVTQETIGMINSDCFKRMKEDVVLVNTARGDIINESDLVDFLNQNQHAKVATDVLADEVSNRLNSPLLKYAKNSEQVIITPHIGGMCREAQEIAYGHAAKLLRNFFRINI